MDFSLIRNKLLQAIKIYWLWKDGLSWQVITGYATLSLYIDLFFSSYLFLLKRRLGELYEFFPTLIPLLSYLIHSLSLTLNFLIPSAFTPFSIQILFSRYCYFLFHIGFLSLPSFGISYLTFLSDSVFIIYPGYFIVWHTLFLQPSFNVKFLLTFSQFLVLLLYIISTWFSFFHHRLLDWTIPCIALNVNPRGPNSEFRGLKQILIKSQCVDSHICGFNVLLINFSVFIHSRGFCFNAWKT